MTDISKQATITIQYNVMGREKKIANVNLFELRAQLDALSPEDKEELAQIVGPQDEWIDTLATTPTLTVSMDQLTCSQYMPKYWQVKTNVESVMCLIHSAIQKQKAQKEQEVNMKIAELYEETGGQVERYDFKSKDEFMFAGSLITKEEIDKWLASN